MRTHLSYCAWRIGFCFCFLMLFFCLVPHMKFWYLLQNMLPWVNNKRPQTARSPHWAEPENKCKGNSDFLCATTTQFLDCFNILKQKYLGSYQAISQCIDEPLNFGLCFTSWISYTTSSLSFVCPDSPFILYLTGDEKTQEVYLHIAPCHLQA